MALPLLFPITLVGILNIYITERCQFAFFYRQPPLFDNGLNDRALQILSYAPVVIICMAYWQFGNR
jgi:hypothetical protein